MRKYTTVPTLTERLNDLAVTLRRVLDPHIELQADFSLASGECEWHMPALEAVVGELVHRVRDAMPETGLLRLEGGFSAHPPATAVVAARPAPDASAWLDLVVSSPDATVPDLQWRVPGPRLNLGEFALRSGAAVSLVPLDPRGVRLSVHLPCLQHRPQPCQMLSLVPRAVVERRTV